MIAMREYMRARTVDGVNATEILDRVGLDEQTLDDMYRIMAMANYEDRYVIPTNHREYAGETPFDNEIAFAYRSSCGFSFGNGCSDGWKQGQPVRQPDSQKYHERQRSRVVKPHEDL